MGLLVLVRKGLQCLAVWCLKAMTEYKIIYREISLSPLKCGGAGAGGPAALLFILDRIQSTFWATNIPIIAYLYVADNI